PSSHTHALSLPDALPISPPVDGPEPPVLPREFVARRRRSDHSVAFSPAACPRLLHWSGRSGHICSPQAGATGCDRPPSVTVEAADRKSTRLNSSHVKISY